MSFELSSKPKRNQETSSQKHMLSLGVVKYRFIQAKSTTTEKRDWNMEQVTSGFGDFFY